MDSCSSSSEHECDNFAGNEPHPGSVPEQTARQRALVTVSASLVLEAAGSEPTSSGATSGSRILRALRTYFPLRHPAGAAARNERSSCNDSAALRATWRRTWSDWTDVELGCVEHSPDADTCSTDARGPAPAVICDTHAAEVLQAAWKHIRSGLCNQVDGCVNAKQAAYHLLFAAAPGEISQSIHRS